jgi:hypothetical protein
MQSFRTELKLKKSSFKIDHSKKILTLGSCFAENIAQNLNDHKFNINVNPFGILYNPTSIQHAISMLLSDYPFAEKSLIFYDEQWHSFYHHGSFSSANKDECLEKINNSLNISRKFLREADFITITFGSAFVYMYKKTRSVVSNCHKIPEKEFIQYMLKIEDIIYYWKETIKLLKKLNPELKIILTVSPIRYLKYGAEQNQLSKATLIMLSHILKHEFEFVEYFPAYEIMLDDLRDYRFYQKDMIHPNEAAIDYIWDKFCEIYMGEDTVKILKKIEKLLLAKNHRPRNPGSEAHKNFIQAQLKLIKEIKSENPLLNFQEEINYFSK